ncbi:hypothetical protein BEP19_13555 [Ammoniphilus oxalaticus]|uniref:Plasmid stabilization protein n=1 Tax=Ammoniphilus oxalaticus TaxID=66863 RepID=A0A419SF80_9BACL|nr:hypothetical protein BEP19_13555 [Ammoniphilus oxalaticus]
MIYKIIFSKNAAKYYARLSADRKNQVDVILTRLQADPSQFRTSNHFTLNPYPLSFKIDFQNHHYILTASPDDT